MLEVNQFVKDESTEFLTCDDSQNTQEEIIKALKNKNFIKDNIK